MGSTPFGHFGARFIYFVGVNRKFIVFIATEAQNIIFPIFPVLTKSSPVIEVEHRGGRWGGQADVHLVLDLLRVAIKIIWEGEDGQHNLKQGGLSGSGETIQMQVFFEGGSMSHPCVMNQEVVVCIVEIWFRQQTSAT